MVEYARKGLIGVLTPQANTTVEPEFAILMPPGYAFLNARMVSEKPTIEGRLGDYFGNMEHTRSHSSLTHLLVQWRLLAPAPHTCKASGTRACGSRSD